jgi:hypothetical protein
VHSVTSPEVLMSNFRWFALVSLCLGFTGVVSADPIPADDVVPTAPKASSGSTVRVGTAVGFIYGAPDPVLALGLQTAIGQRFGRLGLEAEYTYLDLREHGTVLTELGTTEDSLSVGAGHRLAALARLDVIQFGPKVEKSRALVTFYVEGGAAVAWNRWSSTTLSGMGRTVPDDTKRTEGQAGFGLMIFPHRVAWLLGWRFAVSPHQDATGSVCRGITCRSVMMPADNSVIDHSMLFQSSLEFTF